MKTSYLLLGSIILSSAVAVQGAPRHAHANGQFQRSGTYQNSHGGSGTFTQSYQHQPGEAQGNRTWQNAQGGQGQHSFQNTWNASNGTGTRESSTTYANGKTSSSQGDLTKTGQGNYSYTGTHTGVNGNTTDVNKTSSFNPTTDTRTVNSTYTNPTTGKSSTDDKTITYANGTKQVDNTLTGPNGKTTTSDQTYTKTSNGYTKDGTVTGPNGNTTTDQSTVTKTKNADGTITRDQTTAVTGPNGQTKTSSNTETYNQSFTPAPAPSTPPNQTSQLPPQN